MLVATLIILEEDSQGTSPRNVLLFLPDLVTARKTYFELALWNLGTLLIGWNALLNVEIKISELF